MAACLSGRYVASASLWQQVIEAAGRIGAVDRLFELHGAEGVEVRPSVDLLGDPPDGINLVECFVVRFKGAGEQPHAFHLDVVAGARAVDDGDVVHQSECSRAQ